MNLIAPQIIISSLSTKKSQIKFLNVYVRFFVQKKSKIKWKQYQQRMEDSISVIEYCLKLGNNAIMRTIKFKIKIGKMTTIWL